MWEQEFSNKKLWKKEKPFSETFKTNLSPENVDSAQVTFWKEHCLECSPPECYHSCPLYEKRIDKRCVRMTYGIYNNPIFKGAFNYGADVRFKRWAKLGTVLYPGVLTIDDMKRFQKIDSVIVKMIKLITFISYPLKPSDLLNLTYYNPQRILYKIYSNVREKILCSAGIDKQTSLLDCFVMECYSFEQSPFMMQMEYNSPKWRFRDSVKINPGVNYFEIPVQRILPDPHSPKGSMIIYPENNLTVRTVFTWMDFIKTRRVHINPVKKEKQVHKIKCVAWDLDNTLWKGTLIEDGREGIKILSENLRMIKLLDERGIVQTIISKNNHNEAWSVIKESGLQDYFIYPAINWGAKSENLKQIANKLNINVDSFALIDDSAFERSEVASVFPQVKVFTEKQIPLLLDYPEFDVEVTSESRNRRLSYISNVEREKVSEKFGDNYLAFLRDCRMQLKITIPTNSREIIRCLELIQRSNQLNLSSRRYSGEEFNELLNKKKYLSLALSCKDRFGDYGIIGFVSVDENQTNPVIRDFVISCRIAQKMVERSFVEWLCEKEYEKGYNCLYAEMVKTKRNGPLMNIFNEIFEMGEESDEKIMFCLDFKKRKGTFDVIEIVDETSEIVLE